MTGSSKKTFTYLGCCVGLDGDSIGDMVDNSIDVTQKTFRQRIGKENYDYLSVNLGYGLGKDRLRYRDGSYLSLKTDYHVRFSRSKYQGRLCYYCVHSGIEYVFVEE